MKTTDRINNDRICKEMLIHGCSVAVVNTADKYSQTWEGLADLMTLWKEAVDQKDMKEALACYLAIMTAIIEIDYYGREGKYIFKSKAEHEAFTAPEDVE